MNIYKATITSGPMIEIKYYKSFRKRNKKNVTRGINRALTPEKMQKVNKIRGEINTQRLILCNFKKGDWWCRFSAPYQNFTEKEFERIVGNFFRRIKYNAKKAGLKFKYIGYCECGKRGGNWHLHIIIEECIREIAMSCWQWQNGINLEPLYMDGNFENLAKYIRKDVAGTKRLKTSRNLTKPTIDIDGDEDDNDDVRKEYKKVERGEMIAVPAGYYFVKDSIFSLNDFTGASYSFTFLQLTAHQRRQTIDIQRNDTAR